MTESNGWHEKIKQAERRLDLLEADMRDLRSWRDKTSVWLLVISIGANILVGATVVALINKAVAASIHH